MKWLKKCLGLEQIESDYLHIKKVYENNLRTQRELIDMVINFQSNICKEYIEVKDKLEKLEKELLTEREKNENKRPGLRIIPNSDNAELLEQKECENV